MGVIKGSNEWVSAPCKMKLHEGMIVERMGAVCLKNVTIFFHLLMIYDVQGTDMNSHSRKVAPAQMVIKYCHNSKIMTRLAQSWAVLNMTWFTIFKKGDRTQLKQIYATFANTIPYEEFKLIHKEAVSEPHGFLFMNTVLTKE